MRILEQTWVRGRQGSEFRCGVTWSVTIGNERMFDLLVRRVDAKKLVYLFYIEELMLCPMDSIMTPQHRLVDVEEVPKVEEYFCVLSEY